MFRVHSQAGFGRALSQIAEQLPRVLRPHHLQSLKYAHRPQSIGRQLRFMEKGQQPLHPAAQFQRWVVLQHFGQCRRCPFYLTAQFPLRRGADGEPVVVQVRNESS